MQSKNNICSHHLLPYCCSEQKIGSVPTLSLSQMPISYLVPTFPNDRDWDVAGDLLYEFLPVAVSPAMRGSPETGSSLPSQPRLYYLHLLCTRKGPELVGWDSSVGHPPHASVRKDDIRV